jgi:hypothetical protein
VSWPKFKPRTSQIQVQNITARLSNLFSKDCGKKQENGDFSFINLNKTEMMLEEEEEEK